MTKPKAKAVAIALPTRPNIARGLRDLDKQAVPDRQVRSVYHDIGEAAAAGTRSLRAATGVPARAPMSEIESECSRHLALTQELSQALDTLGGRLSPVTMQNIVDANVSAGPAPDRSSTIGQAINQSNNNVAQSIARIRGLMDSLAI